MSDGLFKIFDVSQVLCVLLDANSKWRSFCKILDDLKGVVIRCIVADDQLVRASGLIEYRLKLSLQIAIAVVGAHGNGCGQQFWHGAEGKF